MSSPDRPALKPGARTRRRGALAAALLYSALSASALAERRVDMNETKIHGDQAMPKMMYVVPWKRSQLPDLTKPRPQDVFRDTLEPLVPERFHQRVEYYRARRHKAPAIRQPR